MQGQARSLSLQKQNPKSQKILETIAGYKEISRKYHENAIRFVKEKEYSKAGESLWGAVIEYLKTIALLLPPHKPLSSKHREIRIFVRQLSESLKDRELFELFRKAEKLHANFYENFLDEEEFGERFNDTEVLLRKLFELSRGRN